MFSISGAIFLAFVIINIQRAFDRNEVLDDYSFTQGWIVGYSKIGDHRNRTLMYSYRVNGLLYSRTISPSVDFSACENDISLCANKRFFVIYSNSNHDKSLIDLKHEIKDLKELKFPEELNDFK